MEFNNNIPIYLQIIESIKNWREKELPLPKEEWELM